MEPIKENQMELLGLKTLILQCSIHWIEFNSRLNVAGERASEQEYGATGSLLSEEQTESLDNPMNRACTTSGKIPRDLTHVSL